MPPTTTALRPSQVLGLCGKASARVFQQPIDLSRRRGCVIPPKVMYHYSTDIEGLCPSPFAKQTDQAFASPSVDPPENIKNCEDIQLKPFDTSLEFLSPDFKTLPRLAYDLDRTLFSPGVHYLQDPRSKVYNFDPWLQKVPPPDEFDYDKLRPFIKSSQDDKLKRLARKHKCTFVGSTSSMTHILSHVYFLISLWRPVDISRLSQKFAHMYTSYTRGMRVPASAYLRYEDGVYAVDVDKSFDMEDSILMVLGKSMEKFLTLTRKEFNRFLKLSKAKGEEGAETYSYAKYQNFLLRSQLDCYDDRLPRQAFDLKTRATIAVRLLLKDHPEASGYEIRRSQGLLESFEREHYDMIRSAFLKYSFQARIGNMDGIFVAYHNTERVFGFQYFPLEELDRPLFGSSRRGDRYFAMTMQLLQHIFQRITEKYPRQTVLVSFESDQSKGIMQVYVEALPPGKDYVEHAVDEDNVLTIHPDTEVSLFEVHPREIPTTEFGFVNAFGKASEGPSPLPSKFSILESSLTPVQIFTEYQEFRQKQLLWFDYGDEAEVRDLDDVLDTEGRENESYRSFDLRQLLREISRRHSSEGKPTPHSNPIVWRSSMVTAASKPSKSCSIKHKGRKKK
ncbi:hypothetical protein IWQ61_000368 [Dispira simplex]|nr:hypothetical protein IWQ61_000368 [Dispira simplex]